MVVSMDSDYAALGLKRDIVSKSFDGRFSTQLWEDEKSIQILKSNTTNSSSVVVPQNLSPN